MGGGVSRALAQTDIGDGLPDRIKSAIITPGLTNSLKGMTQYADAGCYIICHLELEGVTVHQREDVSITYNRLPIEYGWCERDGVKLWRMLIRLKQKSSIVDRCKTHES